MNDLAMCSNGVCHRTLFIFLAKNTPVWWYLAIGFVGSNAVKLPNDACESYPKP
jgi:hypothetical protein